MKIFTHLAVLALLLIGSSQNTVGTTTSSPSSSSADTGTSPTSSPSSSSADTGTSPTSSPSSSSADTGTSPTSSPSSSSADTGTSPTSSPSSSSADTGTSPTPPIPSDPCKSNPCHEGSCINLNSTHYCQCPLDYYYNGSTCTKGDQFPGTIVVKVNNTDDLENKHSVAYQELYTIVTDFFKDAFKDQKQYGQTLIVKVSLSPSARSQTRAARERNVDVTVVNIFVQGSIDEKQVTETIQKAMEKSPVFTNYAKQNTCDYYGCEDDGKGCPNTSQCKCKPGLERPNELIPMCIAPGCPDSCSAEKHEQCLWKKSGEKPDCVCMPGYKRDGNNICQKCSFGYSGDNCEDQFQLILTIVGSIAGVLILGLIIALICTARSKKKTKNTEEQRLINDGFSNLRLQQVGISNPAADGNIFPKVRTSAPRYGGPQNPYENSRHLPNPDY